MGLSYKVRQIGEKLIPLTIVGVLAFGGWHLYKKGVFRNGIKPMLTTAVSHIPYFGSRFRHYIGSGTASTAYVASSKSVRHGRAHHGHGRARRHHRHHR